MKNNKNGENLVTPIPAALKESYLWVELPSKVLT